MNKENIGSYLWIIVTVTIMLCLLAFASPFGVYIKNNLEEFAGNFVEKEGEKNVPIAETFKLTIYYNTGDSGQSLAPFESTYKKFEQYNIASPQINGFVPDKKVVQGQILEDTSITVNYTRGKYTIQYVTNGGIWNSEFVNAENKLQTQYTTYQYGEGKQLLNVVDTTQLQKSGMTFIGWYDNERFEGEPITSLGADVFGDKVLYAKWGGNIYNITYVLNDKAGETYYVLKEYAAGSIAEWDSVVTDTAGNLKQQYKTYEHGTQMKLPTTVHKFGYTFLGWSETPQTANQTTQYRTQITESDQGDKVFYAHWKRNVYTITYHLGFIRPNGEKVYYEIDENGYVIDKSTGERVPGAQVESSKFPTKYTYGDTIQLPDNFRLEGYDDEGTVIGWYNQETERITITSGGDTYGTVNGYPNDAIHKTKISPAILGFMKENTIEHDFDHTNLDLYVKPIPNKYDVQYNSNMEGNVFTQPNIPNYKQGFIYDEIKELTKNKFNVLGRTFLNWNSEKDGSGVTYQDEEMKNIVDIINEINPSRTNLMNLYAQWKVHKYNIVYDLNKGEGTTDPEFAVGGNYPSKATYDQSFSVTNPVRYGYEFAGWKVVIGLDSRVAKYGNNAIPTNAINNSSQELYYKNMIWFVNLNPNDGATVTLQAQWVPNGSPDEDLDPADIKIEYDYNKPTNCTSSVVHDVKPNTAIYDHDIYISNPTMVGYIFDGWTITNMSDTNTHYSSNVELILSNNKVTTVNGSTPTSFNGTTLSTKTKATHFMNLTNDGTVKFTAHWTPITYKINYVLNKGDGTTNPQYATNGSYPTRATYDQAFNVTHPTRLGYTFVGWDITGMDTVQHQIGQLLTQKTSVYGTKATEFKNLTSINNATITFTAVWKRNGGQDTPQIYIRYVENKPSGCSSTVVFGKKPRNAEYDTDIEIDNPTMVGYRFDGWTITGMSDKMTHYYGAHPIRPNSGNVIMSTQVAPNSCTGTTLSAKTKATHFMNLTDDGTITFTAHWVPNTYTVTYNKNDSVGSTRATGKTADSSHTYDASKALTANGYSRIGYRFNGWNTKADGSGTSYTNQQSVTNLTATHGATVTLYAQWVPNTYTITYNKNDSVGSTRATGTTENSNHTYDASKALTANGYSKNGYHFVAWNTKADGSGTSYTNQQSVTNLTATHGATVTLYAQWAPNNYTVTYNGNGGTYNNSATWVDPTKAVFDANYNVYSNSNFFVKKGHTFSGWKDQDGNAWAIGSVKWTKTKDITLYAQWTPIEYTIIYKPGTGTGAEKTDKVTYGETYTVRNGTGFSKVDYDFDGWDDPTGTAWTGWSGTWTYANGEYGITNNTLVLTAQWKLSHAHDIAEVTYAAGCTAQGKIVRTCKNAGDGRCDFGTNGVETTITADALKHLPETAGSSRGTCGYHHHFNECSSLTIGDDGHNVEHTTNEWDCISGHKACSDGLYESEGYSHIYCGREVSKDDTYALLYNGKYYCGYHGRKWCWLSNGHTIPKMEFVCKQHSNSTAVESLSISWSHSECTGCECKTAYTITFDGNGGTPGVSSKTFYKNGVTLTSASRTGYTFNGWYTSKSGGTYKGVNGTKVDPDSSVTYYAHWTCNHSYWGTNATWSSQNNDTYCYVKYNCKNCGTQTTSYSSTYKHGSYLGSWGSWVSTGTSQHRRSRTCSRCSDTIYEYGNHNTSTTGYDTTKTQHTYYTKCSICNSNKKSGTATNHDYNFWGNCKQCGRNKFS